MRSLLIIFIGFSSNTEVGVLGIEVNLKTYIFRRSEAIMKSRNKGRIETERVAVARSVVIHKGRQGRASHDKIEGANLQWTGQLFFQMW